MFTLKEEFLRHIELLSSKAINEYDKKYIHNLINDVADSTDYQFALGKLSSLLATHYNQKLLLLLMSTTRQSNKDTYIIIIMKLSVLCGIFSPPL